MKKIISFMFLCSAMFLLVACVLPEPEPPEPPVTTVTITYVTDTTRSEIKKFSKDTSSTSFTAPNYSGYYFNAWYDENKNLITQNLTVNISTDVNKTIIASYSKLKEADNINLLFKSWLVNETFEPTKEIDISKSTGFFGETKVYGKRITKKTIVEKHKNGYILDHDQLKNLSDKNVLSAAEKNIQKYTKIDRFKNGSLNNSEDLGQFIFAFILFNPSVSLKDLTNYKKGEYKQVIVTDFNIVEIHQYDVYDNRSENHSYKYEISFATAVYPSLKIINK